MFEVFSADDSEDLLLILDYSFHFQCYSLIGVTEKSYPIGCELGRRGDGVSAVCTVTGTIGCFAPVGIHRDTDTALPCLASRPSSLNKPTEKNQPTTKNQKDGQPQTGRTTPITVSLNSLISIVFIILLPSTQLRPLSIRTSSRLQSRLILAKLDRQLPLRALELGLQLRLLTQPDGLFILLS
jgi:hypothetical protein